MQKQAELVTLLESGMLSLGFQSSFYPPVPGLFQPHASPASPFTPRGGFASIRSNKDASLLPFPHAAKQPLGLQGHVFLLLYLELVTNVHFSLLLLNAHFCRPGTTHISSLTASFCPDITSIEQVINTCLLNK